MIRAALVIGLAALVAAGCGNGKDERRPWAGPQGARCSDAAAAAPPGHQTPQSIVRLYFTPKSTAAERTDVRTRIEAIEGVRSTHYTDEAAALRAAKEVFEGDPAVLKDLPGNPFPASLEVYAATAGGGQRVEFVGRGLAAVEDIKVTDVHGAGRPKIRCGGPGAEGQGRLRRGKGGPRRMPGK